MELELTMEGLKAFLDTQSLEQLVGILGFTNQLLHSQLLADLPETTMQIAHSYAESRINNILEMLKTICP